MIARPGIGDSPAQALSTSLVSSARELEEIRDEWSELLARSAYNEPMVGPIWLINWWRVYGASDASRTLCILLIRRGGRLVGLAPFCRRRIMQLSMPLYRLELLGSGENEADETCSEYIGIVAERGEEQAVANEFSVALRSGAMRPWDELMMTALSSESVMPALLAGALGKGTQYVVLGGAPFVQLPGTWDEYLAALPSSRRYLIRRSLKEWEKWAKEPPVLKRVEREEDLDAAFGMLASLHAERWTEVAHAGAFASPLFSSFHRQTMLELFRAGALWLCWLEMGGEPVAAIYNIIWNNEVRFYQSGRKIDLPTKVRAGLVIHACAIRQAIEAGYSRYDFLAGTTRYKMQLSNNVRPLVQLSLTRPSMRSKLRELQTTSVGLGRVLRTEWRHRFGR